MAIRKMQLHFNKATKVAPEVIHMHFYPKYESSTEPEKTPFDFIPGQFITLLFDHPDKVKRRSYSISTIPNQENGIEFAISYIKGGIASEALFNINPNTVINAMGPAGKLIIKDDPDYKRYILVGTGTGIAPYRSMLPDLAKRLEQDPNFEVDLIYGNRKREDLFYINDFLELAKSQPRFRVHAQLSRMDKSSELKTHEHHGYAQTAFDRLSLNPKTDIIYLCGNPAMIDDSFSLLTSIGFETTQIRREKYISSN